MSRPGTPKSAPWAAGLAAVVLLSGALAAAAAVKPPAADLERRFTATVRPFLQTYCVSCHGKNQPQAQLDLSSWTGMAAVARQFPHLSLTLEKLRSGEMPPKGARQPPAAQRQAVANWIRAMRKYEAERTAGDPGPVLARRLSNAEYDYSILDLTGQDLRPTRDFPVDPANQEGFDNSGESLSVSPALLKKYLQAAVKVSEHLALTSTGFAFAEHPVVVETDRDKFCILRIIEFYRRQPTDYADYFAAAWRYRHRAALGIPNAPLAEVALQAKVSPQYLELIWKTLSAPDQKVGPIARLQGMWNALPAPDPARPDAHREGCAAMRDWVLKLRPKLARRFTNLQIPKGFSPGGQPFIMWKNIQYATHRRKLNPDALQVNGVPKPRIEIPATDFGGLKDPVTITDPVDPELWVPGDEEERKPYVEAFQRFCDVFPDAFYVAERGRMHVDKPGEKGRYLSAGLHNAMGYFRDDTPLMELILDEAGRKELDRLWTDFNAIAFVPERMHREFFHYERAEVNTMSGPEFDFARSEDKDATSEAKIRRLAEVYLAKARRDREASGGDPLAIQAIEEHFRRVNENCRAAEQARAAAEPRHVAALLDFARRAWRRPLAPAERTDLLGFYRELRERDGLTHEEAIRDSVTRVLMSPNFLFRIDLGAPAPAPAPARGTARSAR